MSLRPSIRFLFLLLVYLCWPPRQLPAQQFPNGIFEQPLADWKTKESKQYLLQDQQLRDTELEMQLNDASLHAVEVVSLDKAFAVGDRGVILATEDGGRNWKRQNSGVTVRLNDVYFADDRNGIVVGGYMHYRSKASVGVVLKTNNGGRSWQRIETPKLPALRGVQELASGELFAWGDMSVDHLTSLFISMDGGNSWSAAADFANLPHLQSAAFYDSTHGIAVDRYGRVLAIDNQHNMHLAMPAGTPPIRRAHYDGAKIWLIGSNGSIYREQNAGNFESLALPGLPSDHALIDLNAITTSGTHVTVSGSPGSVVWASEDNGNTWAVHRTRQKLPINAMGNHRTDRLVVATDLSNLHGSRNGGVAWRREQRGPTRFRVLNVAGTQDSVAWLSLTQSAWDNTETAAVVTVHESRFHLGSSVEPDSNSQFDFLANDIGLGHAEIWSSYPTNYRSVVKRAADGDSWYLSKNSARAISRRIVSAIRHLQPDVIICESLADRDPLLSRCGSTALDAVRKSADVSTILFSRESGIPNEPWNVARVFARATKYKSDVNLDANAPMESTGKILGDVAEPAFLAFGIDRRNESLLLISADKVRSEQKIDLFSGMIKKADTHRQTDLQRLNNLEVLVGRASRQDLINEIASMRGDGTVKDIRWRAKYRSLIDQTTLSQRAAVNLQLANKALNLSKFNRWQFAMQQVTADHFARDEYRSALIAIANMAASQEFQYWRSKSSGNHTQTSSKKENATASVLRQFAQTQSTALSSSEHDEQRRSFDRRAVLNTSNSNRTERPITPFGREGIRGTEIGSEVVPAAFESSTMHETQIESTQSSPRRSNGFNNKTVEFYESFLAESSPVHKNYFQDVRFLIANEFYLTAQRAATTPQIADTRQQTGSYDLPLQSFHFPEVTFGWMNAKRKESKLAEDSQTNDRDAYDILAAKTKHRPHLDGLLDDSTWKNVPAYQLSDAHSSVESNSTCQITYDDDYVYVAVSSPVAVNERQSSDQVSLFIDINRDWNTRYELTVDSNGNATDAITSNALAKKIEGWDAEWYFASFMTDTNWNLEFAIPIAELTPEQVAGGIWGFDLRRTVSGSACHSLSGDFTDGDTAQNQLLMRFR